MDLGAWREKVGKVVLESRSLCVKQAGLEWPDGPEPCGICGENVRIKPGTFAIYVDGTTTPLCSQCQSLFPLYAAAVSIMDQVLGLMPHPALSVMSASEDPFGEN